MDFSSEEKEYYEELFQIADLNKDGLIGKADAIFFKKIGVPTIVLGQVWELSDIGKKGHLSKQEFFVALRLLSQNQNGRELNKQLAETTSQPLVKVPEHPYKRKAPVATPAPIQPPTQTQQQPTLPPKTQAQLPTFSSPSPTPVVTESTTELISDSDKKKFQDYFKKVSEGEQFVSGAAARVFFTKSSLPNEDLLKIWHLSDVDKDGKLTEDEFIIACWLIANRVRGKPIPNALPPTVLPKKPTEPSVADKLGANPLERLKNLDLNSIMSTPAVPVQTTTAPPPVPPNSLASSSASTSVSSDVFNSFTLTPVSTPTMTSLNHHGGSGSGSNNSSNQMIPSQPAPSLLHQNSAASLDEFSKLNNNLQREIRNEEQAVSNLSGQVGQLEKSLTEQRERSFQLKERLASLKGESTTLSKHKDQLDQLLREKITQQHEEEDLLKHVESDLREKQAEVQKEQQRIENLKREIESLKDRRKSVKNDYLQTKDQLSQLSSQRRELENQRDESLSSPQLSYQQQQQYQQQTQQQPQQQYQQPQQQQQPTPQPSSFNNNNYNSGFSSGSQQASQPVAVPPALPPKKGSAPAPSLPPKQSSSANFGKQDMNSFTFPSNNSNSFDDPFSYSSDLKSAANSDVNAFGRSPVKPKVDNSPFALNNSPFEDEGKDSFG